MKNMIALRDKHGLAGRKYQIETLAYLQGLMDACSPQTWKEIIARLVETAKGRDAEMGIKASQLLIKTMMNVFELYPAQQELPTDCDTSKRNYTRKVLQGLATQLALAGDEANRSEPMIRKIGDAPTT